MLGFTMRFCKWSLDDAVIISLARVISSHEFVIKKCIM